tara:strand:+ start:410 stop:571 length:162 start_codon:yes stop_codon:yes gene_type:complete
MPLYYGVDAAAAKDTAKITFTLLKPREEIAAVASLSLEYAAGSAPMYEVCPFA